MLRVIVAVVFLLGVLGSVPACNWDYDDDDSGGAGDDDD